MKPGSHSLSRRQFLQVGGLTLGALVLGAWIKPFSVTEWHEYPPDQKLGRVLAPKVEVKARPSDESPTVTVRYEDEVVVWWREVSGTRRLWNSQRYVETPQGYLYAPNLQPVWNRPNIPLRSLPTTGESPGMWVEVSVPYVDLILANPPGRAPWLGYTPKPRLYYSQIMWVDQIRQDEQGQVWYRLSDRYGGFGDFFWGAAEGLRPIQAEELSAIHPQVENKLVRVDLAHQTLACFEGKDEVYFCRVSTGPKLTSSAKPGGEWATPLGRHTIWRKLLAVHMTGGTSGGGYDLAGIGWTTLFAGKGMAIHSTFWHNNFGVPLSHGCVNCTPQDAQWVFRWTAPPVPFPQGDITVSGMESSTKVWVVEA